MGRGLGRGARSAGTAERSAREARGARANYHAAVTLRSAVVSCVHEAFGGATPTCRDAMDLRCTAIGWAPKTDDEEGSGRRTRTQAWGAAQGGRWVTSRQSRACHAPHPGISSRRQTSNARQWARRRPGMNEGAPWFVLVAGINGAGKSTFAEDRATLRVLLQIGRSSSKPSSALTSTSHSSVLR